MPATTGVVEAVSVKQLPQPDRFENTHRVSIKVGEDWFSLGASKGGSYANKNVTEINKGDTLEFMYDVNGDFKNIKRATVSLVSKGSPSSNTGQARTQQGSNFSSSYSSVNPAEVGQCLNLAVQLGVAKNYDELSNPSTMATAISLYKAVKKQYTDNWDKAQEEVQQATATENHGPTNLDDDIPF